MSPSPSNNGASGGKTRDLDPLAPKTRTDEKMASHFNGIVFVILAIFALGVLIAIWLFHHRGQKIIPQTPQKQTSQNQNRLRPNPTSGHGLIVFVSIGSNV